MKIVHIITGLSTGGAERALYNLLEGGLADRFDTVVISLRDLGTFGSRIADLGVPVYALGMLAGAPDPRALLQLRSLMRRMSPDLIQGWMYHGNFVTNVAAGMMNIRPALAWNVRQSLYDLSAEKFITRQIIRSNCWLSKSVDAVLYNSQLSRKQHETFGFASAKGMVIPNGFDTHRLVPSQDTRVRARIAAGLPIDGLIVGHAARFHPMKDHVGFLRAAVSVLEQNPMVRFLLIGRDVSLENPSLAGIVPADLHDNFVCLGERSDAHMLMQAMDIFCLSSWSEAFPNVLGEAMASGIPCVATDVGDSAYIVGETGRVIPPRDIESLTSAILDMLGKKEQERKLLGTKARDRIVKHYSLTTVVDRYSELYTELIHQK